MTITRLSFIPGKKPRLFLGPSAVILALKNYKKGSMFSA
jgi:hypothetical protein